MAGLAAVVLASTVAGEDPSRGGYRDMDYGPVIGETIVADWPENNIAYKGLAVRLDHDAAMIFDTDLMRWSAATAGGWIDLSRTSHTSYKGSRPAATEGREVFATAAAPGWASHGSFEDPRQGNRGNLPADWARWRGFFRYGERVILSYSVGEVDILESPFAVKVEGSGVFVRSMRTSGSSEEMIAHVAAVPAGADDPSFRRGSLVLEDEERTLVFRADSDLSGVELRVGEEGRVELLLPPHADPAEVFLLAWEETDGATLAPGAVEAAAREEAIDWAEAQRGGAARWNDTVETQVELAEADAPYVTDKIELPFDNPWGSWIRPAGIDFFADGARAAVSTWNGDIWIVSGLDDLEEGVTWRRFASGLFYAMGVAVVNEVIHVTERSQLTRLHDLNGNGEADFYENVNNEGVLHRMAHALCLEVDSEGNFYFYKNGNRVPGSVPDHGALIRVSADGSEREVFASGIRGANTLGIGPGDRIMGADQQGRWVPTARVDWLRQGGFYGFRKHNPHDRPEGDYDAPVCWIPHRVDNSSGAMVYAGDERWGPMSGNWMIGSYGQSALLALLVENKGGQLQGGVAEFPLEFGSGLVRAKVSPADGQLYMLGMKGWQTRGSDDGSFDRVRYTGLPNRMPVGLSVEPKGVRVDFSAPLAPESVVAENFAVERWQYNYSNTYGSPEMSVANPGERGRDPVAVASARLSADGKSVFVEIPDIKPVMQQSLEYTLQFVDGEEVENAIYHTIHRLSDDDKESQAPEAPVQVAEVEKEPEEKEPEEAPREEPEGDWSEFAAGLEVFENTCQECHQSAGEQGIAPPLSESEWAGGKSDALIRIVLQGKLGEEGVMMPFAWLSDEDIAALLSYIRTRWHEEEPLSEEAIRAVRAATEDRSEPWTVEELKALE